jgi:hypothetical protein
VPAEKILPALPTQVSLAQRFFASKWLPRLWLAAFSVGLPLALLRALNLKLLFTGRWYVRLLLVGVLLLFGLAGFLLGTVLFSLVIAPMVEVRTRLNGGPFSVGDMVVVLAGRYRGRRGCVQQLGQGTTILVEFDKDGKAPVEVHQHQLRRER